MTIGSDRREVVTLWRQFTSGRAASSIPARPFSFQVRWAGDGVGASGLDSDPAGVAVLKFFRLPFPTYVFVSSFPFVPAFLADFLRLA